MRRSTVDPTRRSLAVFESRNTSGTRISSPMSVPMDPISPCVCRNPSRYAVRSVRHVSIAKSEYLHWPPRDVRRGALHTL